MVHIHAAWSIAVRSNWALPTLLYMIASCFLFPADMHLAFDISIPPRISFCLWGHASWHNYAHARFEEVFESGVHVVSVPVISLSHVRVASSDSLNGITSLSSTSLLDGHVLCTGERGSGSASQFMTCILVLLFFNPGVRLTP